MHNVPSPLCSSQPHISIPAPPPHPPKKDQAACLENIKTLSPYKCGKRDKVFAEYSFSLCAGTLPRLWQTSSSVSRRWPVTHSVCREPERKPKSPPKTLAKRESSPCESCRPCVLSDFASRRACLLFPTPIPLPSRRGLQAA